MTETFPVPSETKFITVFDDNEYVVSEVTTYGYVEIARGETPHDAFVKAAEAVGTIIKLEE